MKKLFNIDLLLIPALTILLFSLNSCIPLKKTIYLQERSSYTEGVNSYENDLATYKLQPGDNLYIDVKSLDPSSMTSFDANDRSDYQLQSEMGIYLKSYQVNDSGFILFPVVGKVEVAGFSVSQVRDRLQIIMNEFYQLTNITVKLVNFKVSILGEVNRPGIYTVYQDRLNIFQALSLGGDLNDYANRKEVSILRKTNTGGTELLKINLLNDSILELPGFYLQPDDIVYVKPMRSKNFAFTAFPYSIVLSTITTTLLIWNFFK